MASSTAAVMIGSPTEMVNGSTTTTTTALVTLMSGDIAYWPLWVNIAVPVIMSLVFVITLALLYRIPIPPTPKVYLLACDLYLYYMHT